MSTTRNGRHVLLVEDESALLALLKRHLERSGHTVCAFPTAEEALRWLDGGWRPDILVADLTLPGMSGLELAISLLASLEGLLCLLCSGHPLSLTMLPEPVRLRAAVLQKPYSPMGLDEAIAAMFSAKLVP